MGNRSGGFIYKIKNRIYGKHSPSRSVSVVVSTYLETFLLVWLDPNVDSTKENIRTQKRLRKILTCLITFDNVNACEQWLTKCSTDEKIILIVSGAYGEEIVPRIHHLSTIISIYIYCLDVNRNKIWSKNYSKIRSIQSSTDILLKELASNQINLEIFEDSKALQIYKQEEQVYTLDKEIVSLIWYQLLLEILLSSNYLQSKGTFHELIEIFRQYSSDDEYGSNLIDEFVQTYESKRAISWLTRDTPLVRFVNKALREQDINIIFALRFFLVDIHKQLIENQAQSLNVFKLQLMSKTRMEELKANPGQLLIIHGFLFASTNISELMSTITNNDQFETVLFDIKADYRPGVAPFAFLHNMDSNIEKQIDREILFMCGSVFEVGPLIYENSIWKLHLKLTNENDIPILLNMKEKLRDTQNLRIIGDLLNQCNEGQKAKIYFEKIQNELSKSHSTIKQSTTKILFLLINLSEHMTEFSSAILTTLQSFASNFILIINDQTSIDCSQWSQKSLSIFTTEQFASSLENLPKNSKIFLLDNEKKNTEHVTTIDELIGQLADEIIGKYRLEINEYTKINDIITAEKYDKEIHKIYRELRQIHEKFSNNQSPVQISKNPIPILIWLVSNTDNNEENTNYIEKHFGKYFSTYQIYFDESHFHESIATENTADIFVIIYDNHQKTVTEGVHQFPNVKHVYHYDESENNDDQITTNRDNLCYSITYDLIDYYEKLGELYRINNRKKEARDMFLKAKDLCQFLSTTCFSLK